MHRLSNEIIKGGPVAYKARYKTNSNTEYQTLTEHLKECSMLTELFAKKLNLPKLALLTALAHDLGKNCESWEKYLEESLKNGKKSKKDDHGTAGGQFLYDILTKDQKPGSELVAQILAACVMYHHGAGLPDIIKPDGTAQLYERVALRAGAWIETGSIRSQLSYTMSLGLSPQIIQPLPYPHPIPPCSLLLITTVIT